jgi:hypothetical protein
VSGFVAVDGSAASVRQAGDAFNLRVSREGELYFITTDVFPDGVDGNILRFGFGDKLLHLEIRVCD